jgi:hypothetical protein
MLDIGHLTRSRDLVVARITGIAQVEDAEVLLRELAEQTLQHRDRHLLMDLRGVVGALAPYEHRHLGAVVAHCMAHLRKLALHVAPGKPIQAFEESSGSAGLPVRAFVSPQEALAWLASEQRGAGYQGPVSFAL